MDKKISKNNYSDVSGILLDAVMCTILYNLSMLMPVTGFALLIYKIKNVPMFKIKKWLGATILSMIFIGGINFYVSPVTYKFAFEFMTAESLKNLAGYVLIFFPIEILYYQFNGKKFMIPVFDRIIITSIVTAVTAFFYIKLLNINGELLKEVVKELNNIDQANIDIIFKFIKNNVYYMIYTYVGLITYLTYYSFGRKSYPVWRISYWWLLFYIVPFFIIRFGHIQNVYLTNIMLMVKISFVVYGIKIVYNLIRLKIKSDIICQLLAVIIGLNFQNIIFIIAGLLSFEAVKITIIKDNGGK